MKSNTIGVVFISMFFLVLSGCQEEPGFDEGRQFLKDIETIDNYLSSNGIDAYKDQSGIRFVINSIGTLGLPPKVTHTVEVEYIGRLFSNGNIFDQGTTEGVVTDFIIGWIEALEVFPVGTDATVYIPSGLAYGNQRVGAIPPNSILVFDIKLLSVTYTDAEQAQFPTDLSVIDQYLSDNAIVAEIDGSGIRYVIDELGSGAYPSWYDKIQVSYTGKLLSNGTPFYSGSIGPQDGFDSRIVDFLPGLQAMFLSLPSGSKATAYIPSVLGFGSAGAGNGAVPANANLIYEITSFEIVD